MLKTALMDCFERGIKTITLLTLRDVMESAIRLYLSVGFVIEKEYQGNEYTLVDMVLSEDSLRRYCLT